MSKIETECIFGINLERTEIGSKWIESKGVFFNTWYILKQYTSMWHNQHPIQYPNKFDKISLTEKC